MKTELIEIKKAKLVKVEKHLIVDYILTESDDESGEFFVTKSVVNTNIAKQVSSYCSAGKT